MFYRVLVSPNWWTHGGLMQIQQGGLMQNQWATGLIVK